ncbi:MAG: RNA polymerase sigma factor [Chloroflexi bacterium]|nr:RNA polymerase sigma factor [Chloroflexota bacterium]
MAQPNQTPGPGAHPPSDDQLVHAIAQGNSQALDTLYQRHGLRLLAYLVGQIGERGQAEEVLQDVMLAAWRGAANFRGESSVRTWLLAIARHRAINARQRRPPPGVALADTIAADDTGPQEALERQDDRDAVRSALAHLPPDQRETLELVFYHGLSGPEAAEVMGVATGTVKSRLHRAKAMLHDVLRAGEQHDA